MIINFTAEDKQNIKRFQGEFTFRGNKKPYLGVFMKNRPLLGRWQFTLAFIKIFKYLNNCWQVFFI